MSTIIRQSTENTPSAKDDGDTDAVEGDPALRPTAGELDATAFARFTALAAPELHFEIFVDGNRHPNLCAPKDAAVVIRLELPEAARDYQVLLLEQDEQGKISTLSNEATTEGDLVHRGRMTIPRQDASPDGAGPLCDLRFETPGRRVLLAIMLRGCHPRLDRHAILEDSRIAAEAGEGKWTSVGSIRPGSLWRLVQDAKAWPPEMAFVARGEIEVTG
jgi:hypothetical protein